MRSLELQWIVIKSTYSNGCVLVKVLCRRVSVGIYYSEGRNFQPVPSSCWDTSMNVEGLRRRRPRRMARAVYVDNNSNKASL